MILIGPALTPLLTGGGLFTFGLVIALVPSLIWLLVFRRLDRAAPEPHAHLIGTMLLAALLAAAVSEPLRRDLFRLPAWHDERWFWAIPVFTLTQGVLLALTVYAAVRCSAFLLDEFDERTDGIIYGAAAGLGVAVAYNVNYLLETRGIRLEVGAVRIIIASLVLASLGGLVGYTLGQLRFEQHSVWFLPACLLLAALLTGIYEWVNTEAISRAWGNDVMISLGLGALLAGVLFAVINLLVRSASLEAAAQPDTGVTPPRLGGLPLTPTGGTGGLSLTDLIAVVGGLALLAAGWGVQQVYAARLQPVTAAPIPISVPERWLPLPVLPPAVAQWTDDDGSGTMLTLYQSEAPAAGQSFTLLSVNPAASQPAYTPLRSDVLTINGVTVVQNDYAYAQPVVAAATAPTIIQGREATWRAGDTQYTLVLEAPAAEWDWIAPRFAAVASTAIAGP